MPTSYRIAEAAALLGVTAETVRQQARAGAIPAYRLDGRWRFFESELLAHIASRANTYGRPAPPRVDVAPEPPVRRPDAPAAAINFGKFSKRRPRPGAGGWEQAAISAVAGADSRRARQSVTWR